MRREDSSTNTIHEVARIIDADEHLDPDSRTALKELFAAAYEQLAKDNIDNPVPPVQ